MARRLIPGIAVTIVVVGALLIAGLRPQAVRTATAGVPNQFTAATLRPGERVCEGPLISQGPARRVGVWGAAPQGTARLTVVIGDATTHAPLASGPLTAGSSEAEWISRLARAVPGGRPLRVCLINNANSFALAGSPASGPGVTATGVPSGQHFSLVLFSAADHSLLGSLPTVFSRASLWRPAWVSGWTFWVLTILLMTTFGAAWFAVASAAAADDRLDGSPTPPGTDDGPPSPAGDSCVSEDRPQPVR